MPFSWFGKRKDKPLAASRSEENFQNSMLRYAEQYLLTWLNGKVGSDWASRVSLYVIEQGSVCAEALPYRVLHSIHEDTDCLAIEIDLFVLNDITRRILAAFKRFIPDLP